jgi:hypothetical protein
VRAVWSFWSVPFLAFKRKVWQTPLHHLLAWGLSLRTASLHYPDTVLITDRFGKKLLIDELGLQFMHVSTEVERLNKIDAGWWALGKLLAYNLQDKPFVHMDTDVFLWKPLPRHLTSAPVFAQCPEDFHRVDEHCGPLSIERAFARYSLPLPIEWTWSRSRGGRTFRQESCGIVGGTAIEFLRHYSRVALDLVLKPENAPAWDLFPQKEWLNMIVEQFLLGACIDFHRSSATSPYDDVEIRYLFPSFADAFKPNLTARAGYTHLMGVAKTHPVVGKRIGERMRREDPAFFRRCERVAAST